MFGNILTSFLYIALNVDFEEGMTDAQKDYVGSVGGEIYRRAGHLA